MTEHQTIDYGCETWNSSSGQLPYDFALEHAWLSMIEEHWGEQGAFWQFFKRPMPSMFHECTLSKPFFSMLAVSGHLNAARTLFFTANQSVEYHDAGGLPLDHYPTQTTVTLTLAPDDDFLDHSFSTVIFNASSVNSDYSQSVFNWGTSAKVQSRFELHNRKAEQHFRAAVMPLKLAGHPLLKHYKI